MVVEKDAQREGQHAHAQNANGSKMIDGHILEVPEKENGMPHIRKEKADSNYVFVDGLGIGDIGHVVLSALI
jgi:mRNA degradation ribonuclease J1/J2